jgi:RNA polymerase-binding protein DksA
VTPPAKPHGLQKAPSKSSGAGPGATSTPTKVAAAPVATPDAADRPVGAAKAATAPHVAKAAKAPAKAPEPVVPKPRSVVQPMKAAPPKPPEKKSRPSVPVEQNWTRAELNAVRKELEEQARELRGEIDDAEAVQATLKRDASSEGSGDEADAGTKTFEREHEMSLANNSRDLLLQVERALARLDAGTYGRCENCGDPIPKARLQAFPRATLCVACKQREERR